jgi:zinc protease
MDKIIIRKFFLASISFLFFISPINIYAAQNLYTENDTLKKILSNGMTVIIHETHKAPIVSIDIMVKTGSATEGKFSGSGISHLVEHMIFKNGGEKNKKNVNERIKSLGGVSNGFTSREYTGYTVTLPSEFAIQALAILKDIVFSPSFDALELTKEREVILDEIRRNQDNPTRLAFDLSWGLVFQEHPYKFPIIGYKDLLMRLEKKDLEEYYLSRYSPHNMILAISGDINKEELFKDVENILTPLKRNFVPTYLRITEPAQLNRHNRIEYRDISLAHVVLTYKSASISDAALYPLDILAIALGEGEDSILIKELRDKRKLVHRISCQNYTLENSGLFCIYFTADAPRVDGAITAILDELKKIKDNGINSADLMKSKRMAEAEFIYALETSEGRTRDISTSEAIANNYNFTQIYLTKLQDVTTEDLKTVAKSYLKKDYLNMVAILPEGAKETGVKSETTPQFRRDVAKKTMPNGMTLLVCEERSSPLCSISALFLGGVRAEESANNGITHLVSKLLLDGTSKRTSGGIKSEIEKRGGRINNISGNNSFGVTLNLFSKDWKIGIEILSDAIMHSVFNDSEMEKEKTLAIAAVKERDDNILRTGILLFKQNFYEEHPYRFDGLGSVPTIQNLRRDDIVGYYNSLALPGNMVLAITGDVETGEVVSEIQKQFGAFEGMEPKLPAPPVPKLVEAEKEISKSMKKEQSVVIIGFPSVRLTDNDRYIFEAIDSIMSGSDGRMHNIRDNLGMAYALGSFFMPGLERGYYIFFALTSRQNIDVAKDSILTEVTKLKNKMVTKEELEAAKKRLIASTMGKLQKNDNFTLKIALDELYGLGYNNFETYNSKIDSVTANQVKRVANEYFNMKNSVTIIIHGEGEEGDS